MPLWVYNYQSCLIKEMTMTNLSTLRNALQAFDYNHMTPYAVGFDRHFDRLFDYVTHQAESTGYPPYNIEKHGEYNFTIEILRQHGECINRYHCSKFKQYQLMSNLHPSTVFLNWSIKSQE